MVLKQNQGGVRTLTILSQGAPDLLDHDVARRLLTSAEPARPGVRMVRKALRPSWAGVLDFETRFPGAMPVPS